MEDKSSKEHWDPSPSPPLQGSTKNNEVISIMEEEKDPSEFKFHYVKNSYKDLKGQKRRQHYKCNQHNKKEVQCTTKYKVTTSLINSNEKHVVFFSQEQDCIHNHQPPTAPKKRECMEVNQRKRVAGLLHMGVKPARIHQELVTEDPEKAPSMLQLNNLSYWESMKDMLYGTHTNLYFPYCLLLSLT
jgi:hypothetical protein